MTEKRFAFVIDNGEYTFYDLSENGEIMNMNETEDMLNKLDEDNQQYKILVESLKDENQKLKLKLKDLGVEYY
jgi:hypothetical protein